MARTPITPWSPPGKYPTLPIGAGVATVTETVSTGTGGTGGNEGVATGREILLAHNTGTGAHNVTVTSFPDALGRSGDITSYSVAAGGIAILGPFPTSGWQQADGYIYFYADDVSVKFAWVSLPSLA